MKHSTGKDGQELIRLCLVTYEGKDAKKFSMFECFSVQSLCSLCLCGADEKKNHHSDTKHTEMAQRKLSNVLSPVCDKLPRGFKRCRAFVALADVGSKTISRSLANLRVGVRVLYRISSLDEPESEGPTWCACPHQSRRLYTRSSVRLRHSPTRTLQSHS